MPELLEAKKRAEAGFTAPAKGLCLMQVDYE
jgi:tRNA pseudouridine38-40 synthase